MRTSNDAKAGADTMSDTEVALWEKYASYTESDIAVPTAVATAERGADRSATPRHYLMCAPTYFSVDYSINPWMDPTKPVDTGVAMAQWERLRDLYIELGHTVALI